MLLVHNTNSITPTPDKAEINNYKTMKSHKALFLSVHGGGTTKDPISGVPTTLGVMLCYILPIKQCGKQE